MLDLYYQSQADDLISYGDLSVWDELMQMNFCLDQYCPRPGRILQSVSKVDRIRELARALKNPNEYINSLVNNHGQRSKGRARVMHSYFRQKNKYYWLKGGAAEYKQSIPEYIAFEKEIRNVLYAIFAQLTDLNISKTDAQWCGYAGLMGQAKYSIFGESITTEVPYQPGFRIMREHGVEPAFPEQSWTSETLKAEDAHCMLNPLAHRLLSQMDFFSPCVANNGLDQLSVAISTEIASKLSLEAVSNPSDTSLATSVPEQRLGALYEAITLAQFDKHLVQASCSIKSYIGSLCELADRINSKAAKRRIGRRIRYFECVSKPLLRTEGTNLAKKFGINRDAITINCREFDSHYDELTRNVIYAINKFESSLRADLAKIIQGLHEVCNSRLHWNEPRLKCQIQIRLPEPYFDSTAAPLKMEFNLEWPAMLLGDLLDAKAYNLPEAHPNEKEKYGYLANRLLEQCLPAWAWVYITEIEVKAGLSASMSKVLDKFGMPRSFNYDAH